jgi:heme/copper-type cytochrome/quinol oxidase subunit 2
VKLLRGLILALALCAPARLLACAACYGAQIDDRMADGMNWAILTLGVIIATVLGTFLTFLIYAIRKSEALEAAAQKKSPELSSI